VETNDVRTARARMIIGCLRKAASPDAALTDGQLLGQYVSSRDGGAFEGLVRRHGPMVLAVCRRILRHAQDAEDAFQATFLILARKAASVAKRESVGAWLHGVAYRAAMQARASRLRRDAKEHQVEDMPHPIVMPTENDNELLGLLDRELTRLPEKHRLPLVLCELEGCSRREAARQLGLTEGTLSSRLARGRRMLARRMAAHGAAVTAPSLGAVLAGRARATCVPGTLVVSTVRTAGGAVTPGVAALTQGVLKAMLLSKLKIAAWALVVVSAVGFGAVACTYRASAQAPGVPAGGSHAARADDLEALRLEVEALRLSLQATRERVKGLEEEVQALKGPGAAAGMAPINLGSWPPNPGFGSSSPGLTGPGAVGAGATPGEPMGKPKGGDVPGTGSAPGTPIIPPMGAKTAPAAVEAASRPGSSKGAETTFNGSVMALFRAAGTDPVAEVEAAAKKLRERPDDKDALQELERAVHRLKAKQQPDGSEATKP
jgi:RNA polymerase sigma factor (sigma-70 family)